jgi:acetyltransferase-like isoleucine patch superfamily enzyme
MILAKNGPIRMGKRTSIGSNSMIVSLDGIEVGEAVLTAGFCHITAGSYRFEDLKAPIMDQGAYTKGPIRIGAKTWIGTAATILDGVTIGVGAVIGAGSVVTRDVPDNSVAIGFRARVIRKRC